MKVNKLAKQKNKGLIAISFLSIARDYLNAFSLVQGKSKTGFVEYFLIGHAWELYLKARLILAGYSVDALRHGYGHNLESLYGACISVEKMDIDSNLLLQIEVINKYYCSKKFEYPGVNGLLELPGLEKYEAILEPLILNEEKKAFIAYKGKA